MIGGQTIFHFIEVITTIKTLSLISKKCGYPQKYYEAE